MPLSIRTIPLVLLLALFASAQTPPARTPLEEVRAIVTGVFKAIQDGDREMGLKYFAKKFEYYSPGGTTVPPGGDATGRRWLSHKGRANLKMQRKLSRPMRIGGDRGIVVVTAAPGVGVGHFFQDGGCVLGLSVCADGTHENDATEEEPAHETISLHAGSKPSVPRRYIPDDRALRG